MMGSSIIMANLDQGLQGRRKICVNNKKFKWATWDTTWTWKKKKGKKKVRYSPDHKLIGIR